MSILYATVTKIYSVDNLNIIHFDFCGEVLVMMSLDLRHEVKVGARVELLTKPTSITIAKDFQGSISYSNQLQAEVVTCDDGQLLSSVVLKTHDSVIDSIITLDSSKRMDLRVGDIVTLLIKASELAILRVL